MTWKKVMKFQYMKKRSNLRTQSFTGLTRNDKINGRCVYISK